MKAVLTDLRRDYFFDISRAIDKVNAQCVILTHLLDDRPELLSAIEKIAPISLIIGLPYSIHKPTFDQLNKHYHCVAPSLEKLYSENYLSNIVNNFVDPSIPLIIIEIGGYFASLLAKNPLPFNAKVLGVIEDTEAGHRAYEKVACQLPCPVISVARSNLKETEDFLVGASCVFSTENLLRQSGFPIEGKHSLILGFGKVGRGLAHALLRSHCPVAVYDNNPIKRINALSEGFQAPDKHNALSDAEIIYGATGNLSIQKEEFALIRQGAVLVSCSSKDIEFDLNYLEKYYTKSLIFNYLSCFTNEQKFFYLAADGQPVNFLDGAVIGPILALVQSEILISIEHIMALQGQKGIFETNFDTRIFLASKWLHHFCDDRSGRYRLG